jgi:methyl-accepting chemotaxis protein
MAIGLQKQVDAGQLTKDAAIAEFSRRANSMTFDNGAGYLFGSTMEGVTLIGPDPKLLGLNRLDVITNGKAIGREWRDNVAARGDHTMFYEFGVFVETSG